MDILQEICKEQKSIPLAMDFNHIRIHQDDRIPDKLMDHKSQINIECDVLVKLLVR